MASEEHNPQVVRSVQQALKQKGYDVGSVDGQMGPNTENALRQFQQAQGISQTGNLDQQTLSALGVEEGGASSQNGMSSSQGSNASSGNTLGTGSQGAMSSGSSSMGSSQGAQGSSSAGQSSQSNSSSIHSSAYK